MPFQPKTRITPEKDLPVEHRDEYKRESFVTQMISMMGANRNHNLIVANAVATMHRQLRNRIYEVYPGNMRVRVSDTGLYSYPDVVIVSGSAQFEEEHEETLLNPGVIIEVLSSSSESYDRGKKFKHYRMITSLSDYILISQDEHHIEHFVRQPDQRWLFSEANEPRDVLRIASIECAMTLEEIYEKVDRHEKIHPFFPKLSEKGLTMTNPRILFCASEVSPYAKTGGLADVTGALPQALKELGCDVRVFLPLYRCVRDRCDFLKPLAQDVPVSVGVHTFHVHFWETMTSSGIPVYLMEKDEFFDRSGLYGSTIRGDYEDNAERYIAFCQAVSPLCTNLDWFPNIFHLHDWQTALVSAYFHHLWAYDRHFADTGTVFTIHNLGYQGTFPGSFFSLTQLPPDAFSMHGMEFWGQCNFLKAGLAYSDFLTTVSPTYSREIRQPQGDYSLDGILRERSQSLRGILNGVDYGVWNPETDPLISQRYDAHHLHGKYRCKEALFSELGLPAEWLGKPLLGMITRLASQKGLDLLQEILGKLLSLSVSLVILGTGEAEIENWLREMAERYPHQLKVLLTFDERLAHAIEAASDLFLMPSRYEPCGLNQMYSLRYGTIPVVHATGGLEDSVVDLIRYPDTGTGFKFYEYTPEAFLDTVRSALQWFEGSPFAEDGGKGGTWRDIVRRAMSQDFSWNRSAQEYLDVYQQVLAQKRNKKGGIIPGLPSPALPQVDDTTTSL